MIIPDTLERFPACPGYGFSVDTFFLVKNIERAGGFERTDSKWAHPLRRFVGVPLINQIEVDAEQILHFWLVMGGTAGEFRFKDYTDYKSSTIDESITPLDQPFEFFAGSSGGYQLTKNYTFGSLTYSRPIYRPRGSTIMVANEVGAEQLSSTWTLDESTGLLETGIGFTGTPNSWGGEFDVLCRFDGSFVPEINNWKVRSAEVSIREKRERQP